MRKIKTEVAILGSGGAAMLAAQRLASLGTEFVLINPSDDFGIGDLRPYHGQGLWNAAYRNAESASLSELYDRMIQRIKEVYPATVEQSGLTRGEYWSVLSSTPVHRRRTEELEKEFFKLERKEWSSGQVRLVNPEYISARFRKMNVDFTEVSQIEGAVVRSYAIWWDAVRMGYHLAQLIQNKFSDRCFQGVDIVSRYGKRLVLKASGGEEISVEASGGILIFLTGELLPQVRMIAASCEEPWIQGVRKRRREQHLAWFRDPGVVYGQQPVWAELGGTHYLWEGTSGYATWAAKRGPDGLEKVVDESMRLYRTSATGARFTTNRREFFLEWDWKVPMWRKTRHDTYWGTSFEGDLYSALELLWNLPPL